MDERTTLLVRTHLDSVNLVDEYQKLQAENERLKARCEKFNEWRDSWHNMMKDAVHEIRTLRKENAKLKCLALHLMSEYCFAQGTIIHTKLELTEQTIEEDRKMIHKVNKRDRWGEYFAEAYRKAKKALMEGK